MKTISFFGHRVVFNIKEVRNKVLNFVVEKYLQGYRNFLIGSHGDFDGICLSACIEAKKKFFTDFNITLVLTGSPYIKKDEYGDSPFKRFENFGISTIFYDIENVYYKNKILFSNKKMIENSDLVLCYVDMENKTSGARKAVKYAISLNKPIINIFKN